MKKLLMMLAATLMLSAPAFAQATVAGKWSAEFNGQQGPMKIDLDLKPAGTKLDGTLSMGQMGAGPIKDGTVAGTKVSFTYAINAQGQEIQIKYAGELKGDKLVLSMEVPGMGGGGGGGMPPVEFSRAK